MWDDTRHDMRDITRVGTRGDMGADTIVMLLLFLYETVRISPRSSGSQDNTGTRVIIPGRYSFCRVIIYNYSKILSVQYLPKKKYVILKH